MLAKAAKRINKDQLTTIKHDLEQIHNLTIPSFEYQIAITSFALHEISSDSKKQIFRFIYNHLSKDGFYILVDRFKIDIQNLKLGYASQWNSALHPNWKNNLNFEQYASKMSEKEDSPDSLEDQIQWLRQIGFRAGCLQLKLDRALVLAVK